jgi:hypothetical protein
MSRYFVRRWLVGIVGLSLTLLTAGLQAQTDAKAENDSQAKEAAETIAKLRKELEMNQKQMSTMREALASMQEQLQPIRQMKQFQEDLQHLQSKVRFVQHRMNPNEARIYAELNKPTVLEFIETPLTDVIAYLKDYHKIEIQLDQKLLDDAGISSDVPITRDLRGISLRSALDILLRELDLTWIVDSEVLLITTKDEAKKRLETRTYDVQVLMSDEQGSQQLAEVIRQLLFTPSSDAQSGDGLGSSPATVVTPFRNLLIIRANPFGHREVERLLVEMAQGLQSPAKQNDHPGSPGATTPWGR